MAAGASLETFRAGTPAKLDARTSWRMHRTAGRVREPFSGRDLPGRQRHLGAHQWSRLWSGEGFSPTMLDIWQEVGSRSWCGRRSSWLVVEDGVPTLVG